MQCNGGIVCVCVPSIFVMLEKLSHFFVALPYFRCMVIFTDKKKQIWPLHFHMCGVII